MEPPCADPGPTPFLRQAVPRPLAGLVKGITCYDAADRGGAADREIAAFVVPVILSFADPFRIAFDRAPLAADRIGSFVSGLHPGYVDIAYAGAVSCVQIDLTPIGARLFLGRPMDDFATRLVPLEDLGDRGLLALRDRLGAMATRGERLAAAVSFLEGRLLGRAADPGTAHLWSAIRSGGGTVGIGDLARDLGWSRKRLAAHARDAFGQTPKRLARIARFRHAVDAAGRSARPDWADIAAACGYADQAHLVREFAAFAGAPPERWWRGRTPAKEQTFNTDRFAPD